MKTTTGSFDTQINAKASDHVFVVEFSGLTRKYSTGTFNNITANHKTYIKNISITPTSVDILTNNVTIGKAEFTVIDKSLDVSDLITQNNLNRIAVTIKYGFRSLDDTDFISFNEWAIVDMQPAESTTGKEWKFICEDASRLVARKVGRFEQDTNLSAAFNDETDSLIAVDSDDEFIDPANIPAELLEYLTPGIVIEDRVYIYDEVGAVSEDFSIDGPGSTAMYAFLPSPGGVSHPDGARVTQAVVFRESDNIAIESNPLMCLLHWLLTTDDGSGHAYYDLASYDTAFKGFGVGLTENEIDIDAIENLETTLWQTSVGEPDTIAENPHSNGIFKEESAIQALTRIWTSQLGIYMYISSAGKISFDTFDSTERRTGFSSVKTFADDDVSGFKYKISWKDLISQIDRILRNPESDSVLVRQAFKLSESVTDYGTPEKNFELKHDFPATLGFSTTADKDNWFAYAFLRRWFYTFGNPPARCDFEALPQAIIYEPNDKVKFSLTKEIDLTGGSASTGWTNKEGILTGQNIKLDSSGNFTVSFDALIFDILGKVSGFQTDDATIEDSDMDDSTLDPTGTDGDALEAADAYIDLATPAASHAFRVTVQWTNPNSGTSHHLFALKLRTQDSISTTPNTLFSAVMHPAIRYYSGDSNTIQRTFFVVDKDLTATNIERIKIDAHDLRTTAGGAVAVGERPTSMSVVSIVKSTLDQTITTV